MNPDVPYARPDCGDTTRQALGLASMTLNEKEKTG